MESNQLTKKITKATLALAMLLGVGFAASKTANAQYPYPYPYPNGRIGRYGRGYDIDRIARENGRRDGEYKGEDDARHNRRFNPEGAHDFKKATNGYSSSFGYKEEYKRAYRDAFIRGYENGYRRYQGSYGRYRRFPF